VRSVSIKTGETIVIPSPIDVHVHLREPGGEDQETIQSGTRAALLGGYQAVFDMPNNPNDHQTWDEERLDEKIKIGTLTANTQIGFYAGVDLENPAFDEFPGLILKSTGLKIYMGHTTGNIKEHNLDTARPAIDRWMNLAKITGIKSPILLHARDEIGTETAEYIARAGHPVHWCHIASETEVRAARILSKKYPELYTGGVTPHHLTMTERNADLQQGWHGARMQPPLGKEVDAEALLNAYNRGWIQILETDHAPHTTESKLRAEAENPEGHTDPDCTTCFGVSGIEFVLPVMYSLVQLNKITQERLIDSLYYQPAKMLDLDISQNKARTTLKIEPRVLTEQDIVGHSRNHPYLGWRGWAKVINTEIPRIGFNHPDIANPNPKKILKTGSAL
jgi:dihydroorotase